MASGETRKGRPEDEVVTPNDHGSRIEVDEVPVRRQLRNGGLTGMEDESQGGEYIDAEPQPSRDVSDMIGWPHRRR